jgi:hypothetical protein
MMEQDQWDCDLEAFAKNLQFAGLVARDPQRRRDFIAKFHREIALVSLYLNDLSVTGGSSEFYSDPPQDCDFCNQPVSGFGFFVDGQTADGPWANMCPNCYAKMGVGIGWGVGQLYRARENSNWQCIAGGQPSTPETEDS